jgi:hypothetical protein
MSAQDTSVRIEMDSRKFMGTIEQWDAESPSFRECLLTVMLHLLLYRESAAVVNDLAEEFEVAPSTVIRWAQGTATPHHLVQKRVVAAIHRELELALTPSRHL